MVTFRAGDNPWGYPSFQSHSRNPLCSQISHWILGLAFAPALLRAAETIWKTRMQKNEGQLLNGAIPATPVKLQRGAADFQCLKSIYGTGHLEITALDPAYRIKLCLPLAAGRREGGRFSCPALGCAVPGKEGLDSPLSVTPKQKSFSFPKYLD